MATKTKVPASRGLSRGRLRKWRTFPYHQLPQNSSAVAGISRADIGPRKGFVNSKQLYARGAAKAHQRSLNLRPPCRWSGCWQA